MKTGLLILAIATAFPLTAQTLKFDSFLTQESPGFFFDRKITFKDRLDRFVRQLKKERRPKVYLVHYRARVAKSGPYGDSERRAEVAKWEITGRTKIDPENVVVINAGIREADTLEFWIGRRNSGPPEITPTFSNTDAITCPSIYLFEQGFNLSNSEPGVFSVQIYPKTDSRFSWNVDQGRIVEGQGTDTIKVDVNGLKKITVTVVGEAIPNACGRETTEVFGIGMRPILIDEFGGIPESDMRGRLDSFFSELSQHPNFLGQIIVYGRRSTPRSLDMLSRYLTNHLTFRNFPKGRIVITKGGYRELGGMEIYLLPPGVEQKKPRASVDTNFVPAEPKKKG